ncbi:biotin carboxyl carrier protein of acetyl-CoA carboxylase [Candidatus Photodesmus blepharus]|uniref:Biotin carboxyl carrier protein of acetyl-CoA carboxylase n=1 Tax=Candidatus Photodesmus blepharonis TaxID=1179155 RepID=A0A084CN82_9GAMM|nr:acetyl-CoA carboxylase biotin carboxyl carrier protein [Candidatus Photodesmus blepharus]KEY91261.1 biotin carboxyl carrier protein of acetyl-CoA carboxylase [Candidatus Photodesmus blepharus]
MDIRKIKKLVKLIEESGIAELEISDGEESIRISRGVSSVSSIDPVQSSSSSVSPSSSAPSGHQVLSPIVGTFYSSPSPNSEPFIKLGQQVIVGETLCIVEAMKMMNQITADKSGIVTAILVNDGQLVEFEQPLVIIE